ncbi:MAG TPA: DUF3108 domain-containing protein [Bauldia sp.]|nr:DUF3108 domain-containing protein [Bauldia sp.]
MGARKILAAATNGSRILASGMMLLASVGTPAPAATSGAVTLQATYMIAISGISIGRADVKARFTDKGYAAAISGSTYGVSRFVSDARATLAGSGRILGNSIQPASYNLETVESGLETSVSMTMRGGAIVGLQAIPNLPKASDRVPVTTASRTNVVDPVGAFVVAMDKASDTPDGNRVCNRVVHVFDGWKRFDIRLSYKDTRNGDGNTKVLVCAARYVPVAGHRTGDDSVTYMADNQRLEIWLSPVAGTRYLVPSRILIGTQVGDLVITARSFDVTDSAQQASAG